jgi:hypothetical protein
VQPNYVDSSSKELGNPTLPIADEARFLTTPVIALYYSMIDVAMTV